MNQLTWSKTGHVDNISNTGQLWIPDVRGVAEYYMRHTSVHIIQYIIKHIKTKQIDKGTYQIKKKAYKYQDYQNDYIIQSNA